MPSAPSRHLVLEPNRDRSHLKTHYVLQSRFVFFRMVDYTSTCRLRCIDLSLEIGRSDDLSVSCHFAVSRFPFLFLLSVQAAPRSRGKKKRPFSQLCPPHASALESAVKLERAALSVGCPMPCQKPSAALIQQQKAKPSLAALDANQPLEK